MRKRTPSTIIISPEDMQCDFADSFHNPIRTILTTMTLIMPLINGLPRIKVIRSQRILAALRLVHIFLLTSLVQDRHILQAGTLIRLACIMIRTFASHTELGVGELDAFAWLKVLDKYEVARDEVLVNIIDNSDGEGPAGGECAQLAPVTFGLLVVEVLRRLVFCRGVIEAR